MRTNRIVYHLVFGLAFFVPSADRAAEPPLELVGAGYRAVVTDNGGAGLEMFRQGAV